MFWYEENLQKFIHKMEVQREVLGLSFLHVAYDGKYNDEGPFHWTSGFWCGILWLLYQNTGDEVFKGQALVLEEKLQEPLDEFTRLSHDVGFQFLPSAVIHNKLFPNEASRRAGLKAASHLAGRFNLSGRFIRAWNLESHPDALGISIIDTLMNLPLLFWASKELDDPRFRHIAVAHLDTVCQAFFRPDGSVAHIVRFDPFGGEKLGCLGGQGYDGESMWSRGQSWAVYGMSLAYRETGDSKYRDRAERLAEKLISLMPEDGLPAWDYKTPAEDAWVKDSSAGACLASGLLELSGLVPEDRAAVYREAAERILRGLLSRHADWSEERQGILQLGTVSYPHRSHINVPIIYGDYFLLEALTKLCKPDYIRIF